MQKRFVDKVVIVTGSGQGIGRAIALRFSKEGAQVVVNDINGKNAEETTSEIESLDGYAIGIQGDVTKNDDVKEMVKTTLDRYRKIDILVNNVGLFSYKLFKDMTEEDWDLCMRINTKGLFLCSKHVVPHMIKRNYGKIINISSIAGKKGNKSLIHYNAAKAAVIGFTKGLAIELGPYKINVNAVCPGSHETDMQYKHIEDTALHKQISVEKVIEDSISALPLGRLGTTDDVADLVAFLASEDAKYITGQAINVCGGALVSL